MATSESTRARRFALPDLDDERTGESIEAFLEGPEVRRHRRVPSAPDAALLALRRAAPAPSSTALRTTAGRLEWNAALERESARAARYDRPVSVAIVELKSSRADASIDPWLQAIAGPVARLLRDGSRSTDLVARVASTRFQVLLPETPEEGASHFAERVGAGCRTYVQSTGAPVSVRISVAAANREQSLHEALANALRSIEAA